ncbi:Uncharacterized protein Adt_31511 [Abeliophyllum distichum]|uniref:Ubiquitin-like protease family profile domain-containing protein n=1 Tax=Abeliophyllum distichum TaxID=126358 RepID=A0ABD1RED7_9LAMI
MVGEGDIIVAESSEMKRKYIAVEGSSKKMKNTAEPKLEVNDVRITNTEKNAAYTEGLFVNCQSEGQNANEDDDFEHPGIHQSNLMITAPESLVGDDSSSKLKKKKIRRSESNEDILKCLAEIEVILQSNEEILKRLADIEAKVESNDIILKRLTDIESKIQSNEEIQNRLAELEMKVQSNIQIEKQIKELEEKNDAENVANDTMDLKKNLTDCPSFSLGIEFDMTGKSIEGPAEIDVEKSIDEDIINFNEEDWKIVDDVAAHSLAKKMHQNIVCASSSKTCEIDVNDDDVELKDEDWQKIDEIAAAVLAKHKLEETITDDEVTPDAPLKRQKKPATLLQSPWVNQYNSAVGTSTVGTSTVGTTKRVLKGTSAFKVGLFSPCRSDVEAFESWYKQGLVTKKKVKHFDKENITISPCFYFIDIAISSKMWWLELVTTNEALDDTKLLRYGPGIKINATTTDFAFDSQVRGLYDDFSKDPLVLVKQTSLLSYPIGLYMPCNTSWREVDHVLMPLRMYNSAHWILCHFDIKEMCLNIYNSYTKIVKGPVVFEACSTIFSYDSLSFVSHWVL